MSLTDDKKLEIVKAKFKAKLDSIATWQDFKDLINNINKVQVKNFIKNALRSEGDWRINTSGPEEVTKGNDLYNLEDEVDII